MRKEVLGLLACLASGTTVFAQYFPGNGPAPGEPIPVQGMYAPAAPGAYPSAFPTYAPPDWQNTPMPASQGEMPYAVPQAPPYPSAYVPGAGAPAYQPAPSAPGYAPLPFGTAPVLGARMPLPPDVVALPASQAKPQIPPPAASPWQAPPPNALPPGRPGPGAKTSPALPSEPYLFMEAKGGDEGYSEPFFQQIDCWEAVRGARMYGYVDYLLWWTNRQTVPSVPTLPGVDVGSQVAGLSNDPRSGVRVTLGEWITPMKNLAWEASYFYLGQQVLHNTVAVPGSAPTVATLPFFFGIDSQSSSVTAANNLWGAETSLRYQLCAYKTDCVQWFLDVTGGFRYLDLSEGITVNTNSQFATAPVLLSGASVTAVDNFFTHNNFYGGQLGAEANVYVWRLNANLFGKVALGDNFETVSINGVTTVISPVTTTALNGGFLAQPSNSGRHTQDVFAVIPEVGGNINFRVCQSCQLGVGYSFLYIDRVVRPGEQITPVNNAFGLPGGLGGMASQPAFNFQQGHFWAHGLNARIMFIF
jgi:hypothetical protein